MVVNEVGWPTVGGPSVYLLYIQTLLPKALFTPDNTYWTVSKAMSVYLGASGSYLVLNRSKAI
jgi:hypothetical protein